MFNYKFVVAGLGVSVTKPDNFTCESIRPLEVFNESCSESSHILQRLGQRRDEVSGRRISRPNATRYGVKPVASEIDDRYACSAGANSGAQSAPAVCVKVAVEVVCVERILSKEETVDDAVEVETREAAMPLAIDVRNW